ncbi:sialin isoform X1 [Onthophagus taurus]|uniref:sialin isoform X1 n=1 Tax=Onthophagus taurus TaxID=166361 RepID=UPI0039BEB941
MTALGEGDFDCKNEKSVENSPKWMFWKRRRYIVAIMAFFGFFNVYSLRVNLSISIVSMTEIRNVTLENGTIIQEQEFDWDSSVRGYILSSFFYGYITTQIFGGWLANKIGGAKVFGAGIAVTSVCTIITPFLAKSSVALLITIRVIEGVFEGVTYPCIQAVYSRWAPPLERGRIATIAYSGSYVGTVISMICSAYLAEWLGWESIFYVFGTLGVIWFILWLWIVREGPELDSNITRDELELIRNSLGDVAVNKNIKHPWLSMATSVPVWAIIVSHFSENWGWYTLITQLPSFMKDVLEFDLGKTGIMSALPYLAMAIMIQFSGQCSDWVLTKGYLTTTQVRRVFNCSAFLAQTVFMLGAAFWLSPGGSTACLTLAVGFGAFAWSGFSVNHLDIAPQHASVLMGISNTFATIPGIVSPIITGAIVTTPTKEEWQIVFYITSGIYLFGCVIYGLCASGERQHWAMGNVQEKQNENGVENKGYEKEKI